MTLEADHERLVGALCRLAPSVRPSSDRAWTRPPAVRVIDCILSLNRNYDRFVVPRLDRFEQRFPAIRSVEDLNIGISMYATPHDFVIKTLEYNHEARANTLGAVSSWLTGVSGSGTPCSRQARLEDWARQPDKGYSALGIRGFGLAGFQYLRMLFGANTTKPDFRVCEWTANAVGHRISAPTALRLLERAAPEANILLRDFDTTIWEMSSRAIICDT